MHMLWFVSELFDLFNPRSVRVRPQLEGGISHFSGNGPTSYMTSLWQDQTSFIASGVPIPAPLGSPAGPNLKHKQFIILSTLVVTSRGSRKRKSVMVCLPTNGSVVLLSFLP